MTTLSWIGSIWLAMAVILGPVYGYVVYKVGYRWILISAVFCNTFAMMMASISTEMWQLMLTQGFLAGFGASLVWFPCISAPQQYFSKRRGMAVGIAISGSGFGGLVMSNIATAVNSTLGIGWSLRVVGFINLVFLSFAAAVVKPLNPPPAVKLSQCINLKPFTNKKFCILFLIQFIGNFAFNVPSGYLPSYADHLHLNQWIGSNMAAISSGLMIVGKIGTGVVSDYAGRFNTTFIITTMVGVVIMAVWYTATTAASVWAFAALFGVMGGGFLAILPAVLVQCVGLASLETANGWLFFAWFFGGLFGQPICASIIERDGGEYQGAIIFAGVLFLFNGVWAAVLRYMQSGNKLFVRV
ncbi:MFS general substrate transporter [Hesseltinella vesiculosa]|uniref:MFS general substrate transporter n=1 Tax=Hesseltinella vesiculosa TaxID=101127 RepID=A0A1X2G6C5_9FUNG|nr:MFS general substrate transporter [Hesseltinella vesiculosa]